jgi:hypothetical protein
VHRRLVRVSTGALPARCSLIAKDRMHRAGRMYALTREAHMIVEVDMSSSRAVFARFWKELFQHLAANTSPASPRRLSGPPAAACNRSIARSPKERVCAVRVSIDSSEDLAITFPPRRAVRATPRDRFRQIGRSVGRAGIVMILPALAAISARPCQACAARARSRQAAGAGCAATPWSGRERNTFGC